MLVNLPKNNSLLRYLCDGNKRLRQKIKQTKLFIQGEQGWWDLSRHVKNGKEKKEMQKPWVSKQKSQMFEDCQKTIFGWWSLSLLELIRAKEGEKKKSSSLLTKRHSFKSCSTVWFRLIRVVIIQVLTRSLFQLTKLNIGTEKHDKNY